MATWRGFDRWAKVDVVFVTAPAAARPSTDGAGAHDTAEIRTAFSKHATDETLALFDRQIE
jgi:hypothetical protein